MMMEELKIFTTRNVKHAYIDWWFVLLGCFYLSLLTFYINSYLQMDVLEVQVDPQELIQFYTTEGLIGKIWKDGMGCDVPLCQHVGKFKNFETYINHWNLNHEHLITIYRCTDCNKKFTSHTSGTNHVRDHRAAILEVLEVKNKHFKDPGNCVRYRNVWGQNRKHR